MKPSHLLLLALVLLGLAGCRPVSVTVAPPTTTAVVVIPPTPTAPPADTDWRELQPGLHERQINITSDLNGRVLETLHLLRIDPTHWRFGLAYSPGADQTLETWQTQTNADIVLNGGYYTPELFATGLIITNGQAQGASYGDFAGMLTINGEGFPDLRWLATRPYNHATEQAWAGLQSFPMLVKPSGQLGFPASADSGAKARRTVIAQDTAGFIYFIVTPRGYFTLHELSQTLTDSDLNLDIALNLDGGPSSGLLVRGGTQVPAFARLPAVITVHRR